MRFIATTGYYGSGSSAVTDLVREYANVCQPTGTDYEISFFFGYHGVLNLYYWITKGQRSQMYAIEDFIQDARKLANIGMKMNYEKYFGGHFMECTLKYITKLQGEACGITYINKTLTLPTILRYISRIINKIYSVYNVIYNTYHTDRREKTLHLFDKKINNYLYSISEEQFIIETKNYFLDLFSKICKDKDILMVDGLIATHYLDDISKFFDDIRIIIVSRDPRDIYLSEKYVWKTDSVPTSVDAFCKWFLARMRIYRYTKSIVLKIRFEDLIHNYENTVIQLEKFSGIDSDTHIEKMKYFNPDISIKNTQLWKKYKNEKENISYIEKNLSEWLYPYS